jgi:DNA-binding LytR/AlgR family response regulator
VVLDFSFNIFILFLNQVNLAVENVDVVPQGDVLFFRFDEGRHDFLSARDTSGFLDLLKRILNDLDVTLVRVH